MELKRYSRCFFFLFFFFSLFCVVYVEVCFVFPGGKQRFIYEYRVFSYTEFLLFSITTAPFLLFCDLSNQHNLITVTLFSYMRFIYNIYL